MSTDEYIIILGDVDAANKWINGDKTIALVDIVDSFDVFHTGQGAQGYLNRASNQDLESVFGTHKDTDVVEKILTSGKIQSSDAPVKWGSKNDSNSGGYQTSKGASMGGR